VGSQAAAAEHQKSEAAAQKEAADAMAQGTVDRDAANADAIAEAIARTFPFTVTVTCFLH